MKKLKKASGIAYMTIILLSTVYFIFGAGNLKNFNATAFPKLNRENFLDGTFAEEFEAYLKEYLGFHDSLFQLKSRSDFIIGEKRIQGVYITEERLMKKNSLAGTGSAEQINAFYEAYPLPTYLVLVPSASEIYEETLPANMLYTSQEKWIKSIYSDTSTGIRCIDAYHILNSLEDSYIYYRTDSHWTSYGAYYVYQSAIQKMGFTPVSYQKYVISHLSTEFRGDLYQKTLYDKVKPDVLDCYTYEKGSQILGITAYYQDGMVQKRTELYDRSALETENMYQFYLGKPCEKLIIKTDLENDKKLLLYKDDYADCMIPFLLQHYAEICVVNLEQTGANFEHIVSPEDYTQIMILCSAENWQEIFQ